jgi:hypothetical protein
VFLLGFYTLSANSTIRCKLALHQRSALWQHVGSGWATGANNDSLLLFPFLLQRTPVASSQGQLAAHRLAATAGFTVAGRGGWLPGAAGRTAQALLPSRGVRPVSTAASRLVAFAVRALRVDDEC